MRSKIHWIYENCGQSDAFLIKLGFTNYASRIWLPILKNNFVKLLRNLKLEQKKKFSNLIKFQTFKNLKFLN